MTSRSDRQAEEEVRRDGYKSVFTWSDAPNYHYPPHNHRGKTAHLILRGEMTITYPKDENPTKQTFGPGARVDVDAGREHEVWIGKDGCTMVIGE